MTNPMTTHGVFSWVEYHGSDHAAARAFYETVLGWTVTDMPMADGSSYPGIMVGEQPVGGFMPRPAEGGSSWLAYVTVDDVDTRVAAVGDAGGAVMQEPFDVPGVGRIAFVQDPTGARLGFIAYEPKE